SKPLDLFALVDIHDIARLTGYDGSFFHSLTAVGDSHLIEKSGAFAARYPREKLAPQDGPRFEPKPFTTLKRYHRFIAGWKSRLFEFGFPDFSLCLRHFLTLPYHAYTSFP